jgi:hypothetical protein
MHVSGQGKTRFGLRHVAIAASLVGFGLGADAPTRSIDAGGLTFDAPADWKSSRPSSSMRRAELKVAPVEGDAEPAELVVFAFPGGAGSVEDNVKRWQSQFKDANGNPPRVESKSAKGKNVDVTRVETAGHYYPTNFPGQPKQSDHANYRLLGAIVQAGDVGYFLKMTGPDKTIRAATPAFDQLIASMNATKP